MSTIDNIFVKGHGNKTIHVDVVGADRLSFAVLDHTVVNGSGQLQSSRQLVGCLPSVLSKDAGIKVELQGDLDDVAVLHLCAGLDVFLLTVFHLFQGYCRDVVLQPDRVGALTHLQCCHCKQGVHGVRLLGLIPGHDDAKILVLRVKLFIYICVLLRLFRFLRLCVRVHGGSLCRIGTCHRHHAGDGCRVHSHLCHRAFHSAGDHGDHAGIPVHRLDDAHGLHARSVLIDDGVSHLGDGVGQQPVGAPQITAQCIHTGTLGHHALGNACVVQAVGQEHHVPLAVGVAVPCAVAGPAPELFFVLHVQLKVFGALCIVQLGLCHCQQVLAPVAGKGGVGLCQPVCLGLHIRQRVRQALHRVVVLRQGAHQLLPIACLGVVVHRHFLRSCRLRYVFRRCRQGRLFFVQGRIRVCCLLRLPFFHAADQLILGGIAAFCMGMGE